MTSSTASESGSISSPSLGTWKLIKGRVSQAMEDITSGSSKPAQQQPHLQQQQQPHQLDPDDSDADSATLNSSISDDFNEAAARTGGGGIRWMRGSATNAESNDGGGGGSDSDADLLDISHDSDAFVMKKSFDALRSSADASKRGSLLAKLGRRAEAAEWPSALRRRHHHRRPASDRSPASQSSLHEATTAHHHGQPAASTAKDVDIESGVEITEEMQMPASAISQQPDASPLTNVVEDGSDEDHFVDVVDDDTHQTVPHHNSIPNSSWPMVQLRRLPNKRLIVAYVTMFLCCWWTAVPAFIQGMLACLCSMSLAQAVWTLVQPHLAHFLHERLFGPEAHASVKYGPERGAFVVPDYARMPPLLMGDEIAVVAAAAAVVEHKALKFYEVSKILFAHILCR